MAEVEGFLAGGIVDELLDVDVDKVGDADAFEGEGFLSWSLITSLVKTFNALAVSNINAASFRQLPRVHYT